MKLSEIRHAQHTLRWFQRHWRVQGRRTPTRTYDFKVLARHNIPVENALDVIKEPHSKPWTDADFAPYGTVGKVLPLDENHPLYHEEPLYTFKDHNVLVEGVEQAKLLTKTVEVKAGLPAEIENRIGKTPSHPDQHTFVERLILSSVAFDLKQDRLPRLIDPKRPAYVFPRRYGVGDKRKNLLMFNRLLQLTENIFGGEIMNNRHLVRDAAISVPIKADGLNIQFEITAEMLLMAESALPKLVDVPRGLDLPNLFPLKPHISLEESNHYEMTDKFPLKPSAGKLFIHTAFLHFNADTEVKNLYDEPVTDSQFLSRSLVKSFAIAAAQARYIYGNDVEDLPEPIVIQSIHTDSVNFHFNVFQLNTLNINSEHDVRNVWWSDPMIKLYSQGDFVDSIPVLDDYNPEVFEKFLAFYSNGTTQQ
nr:PREDICTED: 39S ribosomal protein L37, mitochondrial [Bemisia tabaci]